MISINATLVLQVIHFLILAFILNRLMFRRVLKLIHQREEHVEKTRREIEEIKHEAIRLKGEFHSKENEVRKQAAQERVRLRERGVTEAEKLLDHSRREVASMKAEVDKEAEKEVEKTHGLLQDEAAALADTVIEKMIGRRLEVGSERQ